MKCSVCGTTKNVIRTKHLPLPNGEAGHITLSVKTDYCPDCMKKESAKFDTLIEAAKNRYEEDKPHVARNGEMQPL